MIRLVLGLSAAVAVAAGLDLWVAVRGSRAAVSAEVMTRARARIEAVRRPGDLVVHSPLLTVTELAPLGDLDATPDLPKAALLSRRRAIVLDFEANPMFGFGEPSEEQPVGDGLVLRIHPPSGEASGALWRLSTNLSVSTMLVERDGRARPCMLGRTEGGFACAGEPEWLYAAVRVLRVARTERACVWAHPTTGGTVIFNVPPMPEPAPGHRLELQVQAGLVDDAVRTTPDGAPVTTEVVQGPDHDPDRRSLGRLVVPNRIGWYTEAFAIDPGRPVRLRITTPRDGRRHHCVQAQVVEVK